MADMNGSLMNFLIWLAAGLVGLAGTLIGVVANLRMKLYEQRATLASREYDVNKTMTDKEIERLRNAVHDIREKVSEVRSIVGLRKTERE